MCSRWRWGHAALLSLIGDSEPPPIYVVLRLGQCVPVRAGRLIALSNLGMRCSILSAVCRRFAIILWFV